MCKFDFAGDLRAKNPVNSARTITLGEDSTNLHGDREDIRWLYANICLDLEHIDDAASLTTARQANGLVAPSRPVVIPVLVQHQAT